MSSIGWEFWGLKFDLFITLLVLGVLFLFMWLWLNEQPKVAHVDMMAGDEGED